MIIANQRDALAKGSVFRNFRKINKKVAITIFKEKLFHNIGIAMEKHSIKKKIQINSLSCIISNPYVFFFFSFLPSSAAL